MKVAILWMEGKRADSPSFVPALRKKGYTIETVANGTEAYARLEGFLPNLLVIDLSSLRTSGKRLVRDLRRKAGGDTPVLLIVSANQSDAAIDINANETLTLPFTLRKLENRIDALSPRPAQKMLTAGPISLDMENRNVTCRGRDTRLTPRLAHLLQILLENHGEVVERDRLFKQAWNTSYTGDTRTLDVHISWLRKAIEEDPRNPTLLITIRGLGYRLDA